MSASPYLLRPLRSLREACRQLGRYADGTRCPDCPLADICTRAAQEAPRAK